MNSGDTILNYFFEEGFFIRNDARIKYGVSGILSLAYQ